MNSFFYDTFTWVVIGFVVAYICHLFRWDSQRGGILSTIIFGLTGAFFGGVLAYVFLGVTTPGFSIPGMLMFGIAIVILAILQRFYLDRPNRYDDSFYYLS